MRTFYFIERNLFIELKKAFTIGMSVYDHRTTANSKSICPLPCCVVKATPICSKSMSESRGLVELRHPNLFTETSKFRYAMVHG